MDWKTVIGFILILGVLIGFSYLNRPSKEEIEAAKRRSDSLALVRAEQDQKFREAQELARANKANEDSLVSIDQKARLGAFAESSVGERAFVTMENDLMRIKISTLGGSVLSRAFGFPYLCKKSFNSIC